MDINEADNRGSTPLHWACYSKAEFALSYILAMDPELELRDQNGLTPLHWAVRAVPDLQSTRSVRSLLLKGSSRQARNNSNQTPAEMIRDTLEPNLRNELIGILREPVYLECFMRRVPLMPIKPNHRTQLLFVILFTGIILC